MTNTEAGLLDDIIANPADDVPRLIYADWLEEHGQEERAEFVRVQVELDKDGLRDAECNKDAFHSKKCRGDKRARCERAIYLKDREKNLGDNVRYSYSARNINLWAGERMFRLKDHGLSWKWSRGFLAEIHGPLSVLQEHLPRLVQEHPLEVVRVTDREPAVYSIAHTDPYTWWEYPSGLLENQLPGDVWDFLEQKPSRLHPTAKDYPTADAAHAALSVALLTWAKAHPLTRLEG